MYQMNIAGACFAEEFMRQLHTMYYIAKGKFFIIAPFIAKSQELSLRAPGRNVENIKIFALPYLAQLLLNVLK